MDKNSPWVLCPSKKFPGKYYYFNTRTEEKIWSSTVSSEQLPDKNLFPTSKQSPDKHVLPISEQSPGKHAFPTSEQSLDKHVFPTSEQSPDKHVFPTSEQSLDKHAFPTSEQSLDKHVFPTSEQSPDKHVFPTSEQSPDKHVFPTSEQPRASFAQAHFPRYLHSHVRTPRQNYTIKNSLNKSNIASGLSHVPRSREPEQLVSMTSTTNFKLAPAQFKYVPKNPFSFRFPECSQKEISATKNNVFKPMFDFNFSSKRPSNIDIDGINRSMKKLKLSSEFSCTSEQGFSELNPNKVKFHMEFDCDTSSLSTQSCCFRNDNVKVCINFLRNLSTSEHTGSWYLVPDVEVLLEDLDFIREFIAGDSTCSLMTPAVVLAKLQSLHGDSRVADSRAANSLAADSRAAYSRAADGRAADSRAADGRAADSRAADGRAADSRAAVARQVFQWLSKNSVCQTDKLDDDEDDDLDEVTVHKKIIEYCLQAKIFHVVIITKSKNLWDQAKRNHIHVYYLNALKILKQTENLFLLDPDSTETFKWPITPSALEECNNKTIAYENFEISINKNGERSICSQTCNKNKVQKENSIESAAFLGSHTQKNKENYVITWNGLRSERIRIEDKVKEPIRVETLDNVSNSKEIADANYGIRVSKSDERNISTQKTAKQNAYENFEIRVSKNDERSSCTQTCNKNKGQKENSIESGVLGGNMQKNKENNVFTSSGFHSVRVPTGIEDKLKQPITASTLNNVCNSKQNAYENFEIRVSKNGERNRGTQTCDKNKVQKENSIESNAFEGHTQKNKENYVFTSTGLHSEAGRIKNKFKEPITASTLNNVCSSKKTVYENFEIRVSTNHERNICIQTCNKNKGQKETSNENSVLGIHMQKNKENYVFNLTKLHSERVGIEDKLKTPIIASTLNNVCNSEEIAKANFGIRVDKNGERNSGTQSCDKNRVQKENAIKNNDLAGYTQKNKEKYDFTSTRLHSESGRTENKLKESITSSTLNVCKSKQNAYENFEIRVSKNGERSSCTQTCNKNKGQKENTIENSDLGGHTQKNQENYVFYSAELHSERLGIENKLNEPITASTLNKNSKKNAYENFGIHVNKNGERNSGTRTCDKNKVQKGNSIESNALEGHTQKNKDNYVFTSTGLHSERVRIEDKLKEPIKSSTVNVCKSKQNAYENFEICVSKNGERSSCIQTCDKNKVQNENSIESNALEGHTKKNNENYVFTSTGLHSERVRIEDKLKEPIKSSTVNVCKSKQNAHENFEICVSKNGERSSCIQTCDKNKVQNENSIESNALEGHTKKNNENYVFTSSGLHSEKVRIEDKLKEFCAKHAHLQTNVTKRIDEWTCSFLQIMENSLHNVLQSNPDTQFDLPCWLHRSLQLIKEYYSQNKQLCAIVDHLTPMFGFCMKNGAVRPNIQSDQFIKILGAGILLMDQLEEISQLAELNDYKQMLNELISAIQTPEEFPAVTSINVECRRRLGDGPFRMETDDSAENGRINGFVSNNESAPQHEVITNTEPDYYRPATQQNQSEILFDVNDDTSGSIKLLQIETLDGIISEPNHIDSNQDTTVPSRDGYNKNNKIMPSIFLNKNISDAVSQQNNQESQISNNTVNCAAEPSGVRNENNTTNGVSQEKENGDPVFQTLENTVDKIRYALKKMKLFIDVRLVELKQGRIPEGRKVRLRETCNRIEEYTTGMVHTLKMIQKRENTNDPEFRKEFAVRNPAYIECIEHCLEQVEIMQRSYGYLLKILK